MIFTPSHLEGAFLIDLEVRSDARGSFSRVFCGDEFGRAGLNTVWPQMSLSQNHVKGTLRGMHFQAPPHQEIKMVRCVRGAALDVFVDLRRDSPTHAQHHAVQISAANGRAVYVPHGFAHGFQTLEDDTELLYFMSAAYVPGADRGVRWNDPAFGIAWPLPVSRINERDASWPLL